jgi:cell division protein FtsW
MPVQSLEKKADYRILAYFAIWLVFGLIILTSASAAIGQQNFGDNYFFVKRQILLGVLPGLVLFFFFAKFDFNLLKKWSAVFYGLMILLLLLVFIPGIGANFGTHASSWLNIFGFSFQPAEFAKLGLIVFVASLIASKGKDIEDFQFGFLPILFMGLIPILLVAVQPDIGTVAILFGILFGMMYVGRANLWHMVALFLCGVIALGAMVWIAPYRAARLSVFLHPGLDPQGIGYHINQAFLAIGSGGIFGRGLGHSLQKFQYLPEVAADSIFAVMAEEMGLVISLGLIVLLILIAGRGLKISKGASNDFGRVLSAGIIIWFLAQSFLNIGAMVGIMPLTGVPLPFMSHGGTALMIAMAGVGILINVSKQASL